MSDLEVGMSIRPRGGYATATLSFFWMHVNLALTRILVKGTQSQQYLMKKIDLRYLEPNYFSKLLVVLIRHKRKQLMSMLNFTKSVGRTKY